MIAQRKRNFKKKKKITVTKLEIGLSIFVVAFVVLLENACRLRMRAGGSEESPVEEALS